MQRFLVATLAISAFALAACGDDIGEAPSSGIRGQALAGPQCPVAQAGSPCPDQPIEATVAVLSDTGERVATFTTDLDGRFEVDLRPGNYTLDPLPPDPGGPFPTGSQQAVTVESEMFTDVIIRYDTGIR